MIFTTPSVSRDGMTPWVPQPRLLARTSIWCVSAVFWRAAVFLILRRPSQSSRRFTCGGERWNLPGADCMDAFRFAHNCWPAAPVFTARRFLKAACTAAFSVLVTWILTLCSAILLAALSSGCVTDQRSWYGSFTPVIFSVFLFYAGVRCCSRRMPLSVPSRSLFD
jgi:hypothetical protein